MQLGISSWSLPWSIGVKGYPCPSKPVCAIDLLDKATEVNVSVVQIADNLPLHELEGPELDRLSKAAYERELTIEVGTRGLDPGHLARYIAIADRCGAKVLRTVMSGSLCGLGQLAMAEQSIRKILPLLENHCITLAFENNEAFSATEFASLMRRIESPYVGVCLDTANSLGRPETLQTVIENLGGFAVVLHAKDYDIQRIQTRMGFSIVGTPVGEGRVDFDWVLAELDRRGRTKISVIVEHWPPFVGNIEETRRIEQEWLDRSIRFLRPRVSAVVPRP